MFRACSVPQLGALAPVRTHPAVLATPHVATLLPQGFSLFESERTTVQMSEMLSSRPLCIQLCETSKFAKDKLLGVAVVPSVAEHNALA